MTSHAATLGGVLRVVALLLTGSLLAAGMVLATPEAARTPITTGRAAATQAARTPPSPGTLPPPEGRGADGSRRDAGSQGEATPPPTPSEAAEKPAVLGSGSARLEPSDRRVRRRLGALVRRERVPRGRLTLAVLDERGRSIFAHGAHRAVLPASTQKLVVAAAALARLGPGFRYTTRVLATRAPTRHGLVRGDLVLVGAADPALAGPLFGRIEPERPRTPLEQLARRVRRAGIRRVTGRIVGDPGVLAHEPTAAGWRSRYFTQLDATRSSGLTVDAGRRIYGRQGELQAVAARTPARQAALGLRRLLAERGVTVSGQAIAARSEAAGAVVAKVRSPRLATLLRWMLQRSDNHIADAVFRTLGAAEGQPTWRGAAAATRAALQPLQLDWSGVVLADGSGLSRANRASAAFLAALQQRMWRSDLGARWRSLLAVSGRSGTLRLRLRGTVAEQRLYGKTGSLDDARSLVGSVVGPRGAGVHVAFVANHLDGAAVARARVLADKVVQVVAEELYGCERVRPRRRSARPAAPQRLRCAA